MDPLVDLTHRFWLPLNIRTFLLAFALTWCACWGYRWLAPRLNLMDQPDPRKMHNRPVPRGGGVAIYFGFAAAVVLGNYYDTSVKLLVVGGLVAMTLGFLDDWRGGISAVLKFLCLSGLVLAMCLWGIHLKLFQSVLKADWAVEWMHGSQAAAVLLPQLLFWLDVLLTLLWVVGVISAVNAIDNMNGLAAGICAIACVAYFIVASQEYARLWGLLSIALLGACLGFLPHNFGRRAGLFMGDAGSFFLGFILAGMGVQGEWSDRPLIAALIPILILAVPLFDFLFVVLNRHYTGRTRGWREALSHCDRDHLSHRLLGLGFSPRQAVLFIYLISMALATGSLVMRVATPSLAALLLFQSAIIFVAILALMQVGQKHIDSLNSNGYAQANELQSGRFSGTRKVDKISHKPRPANPVVSGESEGP